MCLTDLNLAKTGEGRAAGKAQASQEKDGVGRETGQKQGGEEEERGGGGRGQCGGRHAPGAIEPHDHAALMGPRGVTRDASADDSWLQMERFLAQIWSGAVQLSMGVVQISRKGVPMLYMLKRLFLDARHL